MALSATLVFDQRGHAGLDGTMHFVECDAMQAHGATGGRRGYDFVGALAQSVHELCSDKAATADDSDFIFFLSRVVPRGTEITVVREGTNRNDTLKTSCGSDL